MKVLEIVHIRWLDSETADGWIDPKELTEKLKHVHSVGILIHSDSEKYVLSISIDGSTGNVNPSITIPVCCIEKIMVVGVVCV